MWSPANYGRQAAKRPFASTKGGAVYPPSEGAEHGPEARAVASVEVPVAGARVDRAQRLYAHHWDELVTTAERALCDYARAHAPDLVSEAIDDVRRGAFNTLPDTDDNDVGFIKGVLRNRARHVNRREARLVSLSSADQSVSLVDPWQKSGRALLERDVLDALAQLTPRERQLASLHWLEQWSGPEIAATLGISVHTVKELLRRARRHLRRHLARYAGLEG